MITVEAHQVVYNPEDGRDAVIWARADFPFAADIALVRQASIEHDRQLYHVVYLATPNQVTSVKTPAEVDGQGAFIAPELEFLERNTVVIEAAAFPPPTLQQVRDAKINLILTEFDTTLASGFTTANGILMDAREENIVRFDNGYQLATRGGATTLLVRDFNNVNHDLPLPDANTMIIELGQNWQTSLARLWVAKDAVAAATSETAVNAVIF